MSAEKNIEEYKFTYQKREIFVKTDELTFLGWLWNWVEGKRRISISNTFPFGASKPGQIVLSSMKRRANGGDIKASV